MIEITLPWPDKRLSPNARVHWREKAGAADEAHRAGYLVALATEDLPYVLDGLSYVVSYEFCPPDRRRRDQDNYLGMMKNYVDGVFHYLRSDDSRIKRTVLEWGEVVKGGKVVLRLEEME